MTVQILRFGDIFTPPHLFSTTVPFSIITLMTKAAIGLRGQRDDGAAPYSQEAEEPPREMVAGGRGIDQSECLGRAGRSGESGAVKWPTAQTGDRCPGLVSAQDSSREGS